jgi:tripartite-type tricarboxylate transporter receptor subunit TctC
MKKYIVMGVCLLCTAVLIGSFGYGIASAADAAKFYKGKVLEFIVPYSPGGGTDTYARMIAPFIGKYTGTTVVIRNMPGAATIYGNNFLYSAKPTGLRISITNTSGMVLAQLFKQKGVRYDINKFNWLGRIVGSKRVFLVGKNTPYHTLKDLEAAKQIKISSSGPTSAASLTYVLLGHALDWPPGKLAQIYGYSSGRELMMAVMQGETDATCLAHSTAARFHREGLVRAMLTVAEKRSVYLPDAPTPYEQVKISKEKGWPLTVFLSLEEIRRGLITSPGVPKDKVDFLREAISQTLKDKKLLAKAAKVKRGIDPLGGKEMEKAIKEKVGSLTEKQISEFRYISFEKYSKK